MCDYEFIKKCKNYNIKNCKGWKYETIIKRSLNKIKKIRIEAKRVDEYYYIWEYGAFQLPEYLPYYLDCKGVKRMLSTYNNKQPKFNDLLWVKTTEVFKFVEQEIDKEKFKMSVHYLKTKLPDGLILNIGSFL